MQNNKILYILPWLPYPLVSGGCQAIFNGILAVKDDIDIYITFPTFECAKIKKDIITFMQAIPNVKVIPFYKTNHNLIERLLRRIRIIFSKKSLMSWEYDRIVSSMFKGDIFDDMYLDFINKIINEKGINIVQVEMMRNLPIVLGLPQNIKKIFVHHELQFVRLALLSNQLQLSPSQRLRGHIANMLEVSMLNRYDKIVCLSSIDSEKLRNNGVNIPIIDSFAIVNTTSKYDLEKKFFNNRIITFIGAGTHSPNINGLKWFISKCWPLVLKKSPDYKLKVIGKWSVLQKKQLGDCKNIDFCGFVDNLYEVLNGTVMIVPILVGSGIRMKILEAMNYGVPFVTTTVGVEGINVKDDYHCFIEDQPDKFVEAILKYEDIQIAQLFAKRCHQFVTTNYSLDALRTNRLTVYNSL